MEAVSALANIGGHIVNNAAREGSGLGALWSWQSVDVICGTPFPEDEVGEYLERGGSVMTAFSSARDGLEGCGLRIVSRPDRGGVRGIALTADLIRRFAVVGASIEVDIVGVADISGG